MQIIRGFSYSVDIVKVCCIQFKIANVTRTDCSTAAFTMLTNQELVLPAGRGHHEGRQCPEVEAELEVESEDVAHLNAGVQTYPADCHQPQEKCEKLNYIVRLLY